MKKSSSNQSAFVIVRISLALLLLIAGISLASLGFVRSTAAEEQQQQQTPSTASENSGIQFGQSYHNDISPALRDLPAIWPPKDNKNQEEERAREMRRNPRLPLPLHVDEADPVVDHGILGLLAPDAMPATIRNMDGIVYPGVACNCAPPDTNGAVGATQYVQMVNEGYQVFNKSTGASVLGPLGITSIWSGFGGLCQTSGAGDPVVLYDKIANRWLISQFAGTSIPTDECIAISTTSDATGSYFRYAFHLGSNFFDYPHLGVWPDGYYMSMNVFNSSGSAFLGPQAFAFDRAKMLTGVAATFVTPGITGGSSEPSFLPADVDGSILPTAGVGNPFVSFPGSGTYKTRLFHADFVTPGNTTFNQIGAPAAAGFTQITTGAPQTGTTTRLDTIGDRLMFRLAYRKFSDGHEAVVGNYTVSATSVAAVRWFEIRGVTTVPVVFQESTYQPDTTWRWMGSAAMDNNGNLAVGYSASTSSINPQIRYAGRLAGDANSTLAQGEATLFAGTGSQTGGGTARWGDYSAMTVDPSDDCTFWYTQEYFSTNGGQWRTRIGSFKFPTCVAGPTPTPTATPTPTPTPTPSPTPTPTPTPTPVPTASPTPTPSATPAVAAVMLPIGTVNTSVTNFVQTVTTTNIPASSSFVGFQGDFSFDSAVVSFQAAGTSGAGLTSTNWNVSSNILNIGPGTIKALRVSAFSNDFTPLSGSGVLFNLNMVRISSSPGANTPLIWQADPNNFQFISDLLETSNPGSTPNGSITIQAGTINISGTATYCSNPSLNPVPGIIMTLTGTTSGSATTDGSGNYLLTGLTSGGNYTVTPTKTALAPGSAGITTVDVVAVQRHFLNMVLIPPGCRLTAADVNNSTTVDTSDVIAIQRFALGMSTGLANVGKYNFSPTNRTYASIASDQTGQNYDVLVFGDVASGFVHRPTGGESINGNEIPATVSSVELPQAGSVAPVTTTAIDSKSNLVGFQCDIVFDERLVTFESVPVERAGLTAGNWNVTGNVLSGTGPMRTLRVSAYSNDFAPLSGSGALFNLKMKAVSGTTQKTALHWASSPNNLIFIDTDLNVQGPLRAGEGSADTSR